MNPVSGIGMRTCPLRLITVLAAMVTLLLAAGCGSGGHPNIATPPPGGSFSDSNLNGTYVFSFSGTDGVNGTFFAVAGTFSANGGGSITGGTMDLGDLAFGNVPGQSITGGSYNVTSDGRGSGTLQTNSPLGTIGIDFVLTSSSRGLITRFDGAGSGSGTVDLMASGVTQSSLQGSYAFGLSGVDSIGNPLGTVGGFTLDANGNVTAGTQDFNDFGSPQTLPIASGSTVTIISTPGNSRLTTNANGFSSLVFDVWVIDATHLKFIETDTTAVLEGDAFVSTGHTSFPSGTLVLTMSGLDSNSLPFATGGLFTSDGSGNITNGTQDLNDEGTVPSPLAFNGSFATVSGRPQMSLNSVYNGDIVNNTLVTSSPSFAAYPYNGGVQLLEIDGGGITAGVAYLQSATSVASPQGYGLNLSGVNLNSGAEVDEIAEFVASSGSMSGLYDVNNIGVGLAPDLGLGGAATYSVASNGRGTGVFPNLQQDNSTLLGALSFTFYVVDSSTIVFLETDNSQVALGSFQSQSASKMANTALAHFNMLRSKAPARNMRRELNR